MMTVDRSNVSNCSHVVGADWMLCADRWSLLVIRACGVWIALVLAASTGGCGSKPKDAIHSASPRLRVIAVMYGRYMGDYSGAMPANEQEFIKYIDLRDAKLVQQYGFQNAAGLLANTDDKPRLIVLYRDQRKHSGTNYVALEEVDGGAKRYAVDLLGVVEEITNEQAAPLLAGK